MTTWYSIEWLSWTSFHQFQVVGRGSGFQSVIYISTHETNISAVASVNGLPGHWVREGGNWGSHVDSWPAKAGFTQLRCCAFQCKPEPPGGPRELMELTHLGGQVSDKEVTLWVPLWASCNFSEVRTSDLLLCNFSQDTLLLSASISSYAKWGS